MATAHSKDSRILVNDRHVSGDLRGWSTAKTCPLADETNLLSAGGTTKPGIVAGSISLKGYLDSATTSLAAEAVAAAGAENALLVTACPDGTAVGATALMAVCDQTGFLADASHDAVVPLAIEALPDSGVDWGVVLHGLTAETADANAASVNHGAATANGGVAALHLSAFSGLTNVVVKVQHSANNSTWADLVTFATATGLTSERVVVATGTAVDQYLRATVDVTGTGTCTPAVAFARR